MAIFSALVCPAGPFWLSTKATCPLAAPDPVFVLFFNTKARPTLPLATSTSRSKPISTLRLVWSGEEGRGARGGGTFLWPGESVTAPPFPQKTASSSKRAWHCEQSIIYSLLLQGEHKASPTRTNVRGTSPHRARTSHCLRARGAGNGLSSPWFLSTTLSPCRH